MITLIVPPFFLYLDLENWITYFVLGISLIILFNFIIGNKGYAFKIFIILFYYLLCRELDFYRNFVFIYIYYIFLFLYAYIETKRIDSNDLYLFDAGNIISKTEYVKNIIYTYSMYLIYAICLQVYVRVTLLNSYHHLYPEWGAVFLSFFDSIDSSLKDIFGYQEKLYGITYQNSFQRSVSIYITELYYMLYAWIPIYFISLVSGDTKKNDKFSRLFYVVIHYYRKNFIKAWLVTFIFILFLEPFFKLFISKITYKGEELSPDVSLETLYSMIVNDVSIGLIKTIFLLNFFQYETRKKIYNKIDIIIFSCLFMVLLWLVFFKANIYLTSIGINSLKDSISFPMFLFCSYFTLIFAKYFNNLSYLQKNIISLISISFYVCFLTSENFNKTTGYLHLICILNIYLYSNDLFKFKQYIASKIYD
jgi:hypothetical protein